jgi:hypothetical protein
MRTPTPYLVLLAGLAAAASADTLVLRNGQSVDGELVSVRGDEIEFRDARGRYQSYGRREVRRIELGSGGSSWTGGGSSEDVPRGMRERIVRVEARSPETDTGIDVQSGRDVYFRAKGKVRWGPDRSDGPEGEGGRHTNPNRPMPNRPGAALIGRVGADAFFLIGGEKGPLRMPRSGRLYLAVNDDYLQDNSGSFEVTVYY